MRGGPPSSPDAAAGEIRIRPLDWDHLPQVYRLERICFADPWSKESFRQEARRMEAGAASRVLLEGRVVRAYSVAWFTGDEGHLANLAVHPRHRGRGFARALMDDLIHEGKRRRARSIWLEVRVGNSAAIALYESFRFSPVAVRKNYYSQGQEDALVMMRLVSPDEDEPPAAQ